MKNLFYALCCFLFIVGLVSMAYCQPQGTKESPAQVETTKDVVFKVTELQGTDSDGAYIDEVTNKRFNDLIPQFAGGLFAAHNKVKVIEVSRKLLVPMNKNARVGANGQELVTRSFQWAVRPLGANLEDLITTRNGELRFFRPYFSALTKGGSIIRGGSVYGLSPDELDVVLRVTPNRDGKGQHLTFIKIVG